MLLDGLDELLQASEHDRSRYLEDVMDFQERESTQRRPVIAVVTSRTVVADRVRVPEGTTTVKRDAQRADDRASQPGFAPEPAPHAGYRGARCGGDRLKGHPGVAELAELLLGRCQDSAVQLGIPRPSRCPGRRSCHGTSLPRATVNGILYSGIHT
jgi:hypothetical protein